MAERKKKVKTRKGISGLRGGILGRGVARRERGAAAAMMEARKARRKKKK